MTFDRHSPARLGRTQRLVLHLLGAADRAPSAQDLAFSGFGLSESAVRGAIERLGRRGLVDPAGWDDRNHRTYCLTRTGADVERAINGIVCEDCGNLSSDPRYTPFEGDLCFPCAEGRRLARRLSP